MFETLGLVLSIDGHGTTGVDILPLVLLYE